MARTSQTTQVMDLSAGLVPAMTGPGVDGDIVDVSAKAFLHVNNASASPITVTVQTPVQVEALDVAEAAFTVAAGVTRMIPLARSSYRRAVGSTDAGRAYVDYSSVTSVTRAVVSTP